jgi:hypothetical protein
MLDNSLNLKECDDLKSAENTFRRYYNIAYAFLSQGLKKFKCDKIKRISYRSHINRNLSFFSDDFS